MKLHSTIGKLTVLAVAASVTAISFGQSTSVRNEVQRRSVEQRREAKRPTQAETIKRLDERISRLKEQVRLHKSKNPAEANRTIKLLENIREHARNGTLRHVERARTNRAAVRRIGERTKRDIPPTKSH